MSCTLLSSQVSVKAMASGLSINTRAHNSAKCSRSDLILHKNIEKKCDLTVALSVRGGSARGNPRAPPGGCPHLRLCEEERVV